MKIIILSIICVIAIISIQCYFFSLKGQEIQIQSGAIEINQARIISATLDNGTDTKKLEIGDILPEYVFLPPMMQNASIPIHWQMGFNGSSSVPDDAWCDIKINDTLLSSHVNFTEYYYDNPILPWNNRFWQYFTIEKYWTYNITILAFWQEEMCNTSCLFSVVEYPENESYTPFIYGFSIENDGYLYNTEFGNLTIAWDAYDSFQWDPFPTGIQRCDVYINGSYMQSLPGAYLWIYQVYSEPVQRIHNNYDYFFELPVHVGESYNITIVVYDEEGYSVQNTYLFTVQYGSFVDGFITLPSIWILVVGIISCLGISAVISRKTGLQRHR